MSEKGESELMSVIKEALDELEKRKDRLGVAIRALEEAAEEGWNGESLPHDSRMEEPPEKPAVAWPPSQVVSPKKTVWTAARRKALSRTMKARWAESQARNGKTHRAAS